MCKISRPIGHPMSWSSVVRIYIFYRLCDNSKWWLSPHIYRSIYRSISLPTYLPIYIYTYVYPFIHYHVIMRSWWTVYSSSSVSKDSCVSMFWTYALRNVLSCLCFRPEYCFLCAWFSSWNPCLDLFTRNYCRCCLRAWFELRHGLGWCDRRDFVVLCDSRFVSLEEHNSAIYPSWPPLIFPFEVESKWVDRSWYRRLPCARDNDDRTWPSMLGHVDI